MSWADKCNNTLDFRSNCSEEKTEKKGPDLDLDLWSKMSIQRFRSNQVVRKWSEETLNHKDADPHFLKKRR